MNSARISFCLFLSVFALQSEQLPVSFSLDPSPEEYGAALKSSQIKDTFIQTTYVVDPAKAEVGVEQIEFLPGSGDFLISKGVGDANLIRRLQAEEALPETDLTPTLAWINGSSFAFHDKSASWFKASRAIAPSLSKFRIIAQKEIPELAYAKNKLIETLNTATRSGLDSLLIDDTKKALEKLDREERMEFSLSNERYVVLTSPSGLVSRMTTYRDGVVTRVVVNSTTTGLSKALKVLVDAEGGTSQGITESEASLFEKLAGKPSFGMFLVPHEGYYQVAAIDPRGPAYKSGLRKNDLITSLNGMSTLKIPPPDLTLILSTASDVKFNFLRDGKQTNDVSVRKEDYLNKK